MWMRSRRIADREASVLVWNYHDADQRGAGNADHRKRQRHSRGCNACPGEALPHRRHAQQRLHCVEGNGLTATADDRAVCSAEVSSRACSCSPRRCGSTWWMASSTIPTELPRQSISLRQDHLVDRTRSGLMNRRWYYVGMVAVAIAISYFDRQTLPVAIAAIQRNIPLSNQQFSYLQTAFLLSYAALYVLGGRLLDLLGTRKGFLLIMLWWSLACALHALATGFGCCWWRASFSARAKAEPSRSNARRRGVDRAERAIDRDGPHQCRHGRRLRAGSAAYRLGASATADGAPCSSVAGAAGLVWVLWWAHQLSLRIQRRSPSNTLDARAGREHRSAGAKSCGMRNVQAFVFAKFMSDSAWYFLLFWLPKYLYDARGFDIKHVSYYAWIPYAASGVGSFLGGWFSSRLAAQRPLARLLTQVRARSLRGRHAGRHAGFDCAGAGCACCSSALRSSASSRGRDSIMTLPDGYLPALRRGHRRRVSSASAAPSAEPSSAWSPDICWAMALLMRRCLFLSERFTSSAFLPFFCSRARFNH